MIIEAIFAFLHYVSFIVLISMLVVEWVVYDRKLNAKQARTLMTADRLLGISAMFVIITGFLKAFYFGKGADYYFTNYIFYTKLALVLIIALLSIYPTIRFLKWRGPIEAGKEEILLEEQEYLKTRSLLRIQLVLVPLVPLLAALMARGIGF